jgi:hypothetical protein
MQLALTDPLLTSLPIGSVGWRSKYANCLNLSELRGLIGTDHDRSIWRSRCCRISDEGGPDSARRGQVTYRSRYLESATASEAKAAGELVIGEFGTDPSRTLFEQVAYESWQPAPLVQSNRYGRRCRSRALSSRSSSIDGRTAWLNIIA